MIVVQLCSKIALDLAIATKDDFRAMHCMFSRLCGKWRLYNKILAVVEQRIGIHFSGLSIWQQVGNLLDHIS